MAERRDRRLAKELTAAEKVADNMEDRFRKGELAPGLFVDGLVKQYNKIANISEEIEANRRDGKRKVESWELERLDRIFRERDF